MKCRNCGAEIPDGKLFCPRCGTEVRLVPDYTGIDILTAQKRYDEESGIRKKRTERYASGQHPVPRVLLVILGAALAVLLSAGAIELLDRNEAESYDFQKTCAFRALARGDYAEAGRYINAALALRPSSLDAMILKADILKKAGDRESAKEILLSVTEADLSFEAVSLLAEIYDEEGDDSSLVQLVKKSGEESLLRKYADRFAEAPVFSLKSGGTYESGTRLQIHAASDGTIYYTEDGSQPDADSTAYAGPVLLPDGTCHVRAVFISSRGVMSDVTEGVFYVGTGGRTESAS